MSNTTNGDKTSSSVSTEKPCKRLQLTRENVKSLRVESGCKTGLLGFRLGGSVTIYNTIQPGHC